MKMKDLFADSALVSLIVGGILVGAGLATDTTNPAWIAGLGSALIILGVIASAE